MKRVSKGKGSVLLESIIGLTLLVTMAVVTIMIVKEVYQSREKRMGNREKVLLLEALVKEMEFNYTKEELEGIKKVDLQFEEETLNKLMDTSEITNMPLGEDISININTNEMKEVIVDIQFNDNKKIKGRVIKKE